MWCPYVIPSTLEGWYMSHVPCFKCCMSMFQLFQLNISYVSSECFSCFDKLEYMYHIQMNVVTHQNTLATFIMSLGTMFMKVISPNYASKY
jgi:hypothetical protein